MQELSFKLNSLTLRGLGFGDPNKPLILALHGWLDNAASFIPLSAYLDDYYIVALDITGHGNSDHRHAGSHYHLLDFVYDLHELVESQLWSNFILLGHSMGGIIASLYTSCFSEKVTQLISIESFGPMTKEPQSSPEQLRESIENRLNALKTPTTHPSSLSRTIEARAKAGDMSQQSAALLVNRNVEKRNENYYFKTDRRLRTSSTLRLTDEQAEAFMRKIHCPMLLIQGTQGFESMRKAFEQRQSWVAKLKSVKCAGHHHLHMDNPAEIAQHIVSFIKNV